MGVSLKELIEADLIEPGEDVLEIVYQGAMFRAELKPSGTIVFQGNTFETPSGWALSVIRSINPGRKAVDGWKSVKYKGQLLEELSAKYAGDELAKEEMLSDDDSPYGNTRNRTKSLRDLSAKEDNPGRLSPKRDDYRPPRSLQRNEDDDSHRSQDQRPKRHTRKDECPQVKEEACGHNTVRRSARLVTSRTSGSDTAAKTSSGGHRRAGAFASAKGQGQYVLSDGTVYDLPEDLAGIEPHEDYHLDEYEGDRESLEMCSEREFYDDWCRFMYSQGLRTEVDKWIYCRFHLNYRPLDIFGLYRSVTSRGGWPGRKSKKELECEGARARRLKGKLSWEGDIFRQMLNYRQGHHATSVGNMLITYYEKLLVGYEKAHPEDICWHCGDDGEATPWYLSPDTLPRSASRATLTHSDSDGMVSSDESEGYDDEMDTGGTPLDKAGGHCGMDMLLRCMEMDGDEDQGASGDGDGGPSTGEGSEEESPADVNLKRPMDNTVEALLRDAKRTRVDDQESLTSHLEASSMFRTCVSTLPALKDGEKMVLGQVMSSEVADLYDKSRNSYLRTVVDCRQLVCVCDSSSAGVSRDGAALARQLDAQIRNAMTTKRNSVTIDLPHNYFSNVPSDLPVHTALETVPLAQDDCREWLRGKEVLRVRPTVSSIPANTVLGPLRGYMTFWQQFLVSLDAPPAGWLGGRAAWKMALEESAYQLASFNPAHKEGNSTYLDKSKWEEQYSLVSSSLMYGNALSLAVDPRADPLNYPHEEVCANARIVEFQVGHWAFPFLVSTKSLKAGEEVELDQGCWYWKLQRCRREQVESAAVFKQVLEVARSLRHSNEQLNQDMIAMKRKYSTLQFDLAAVQRDMVEVRTENAVLHEQTADAMSRQCAAAMDIGELIDKADKLRQELEGVQRQRDVLVRENKELRREVELLHQPCKLSEGPSDSEDHLTAEQLPSEKENELPAGDVSAADAVPMAVSAQLVGEGPLVRLPVPQDCLAAPEHKEAQACLEVTAREVLVGDVA